MEKKIAYINFFFSQYKDKEALLNEQYSSLSYKIELGKMHIVHYLLNNNLELNEKYHSIYLKSEKLNRW